MDRITINVTQDDIDRGEQSGTSSCPVARAITREIGTRVSVLTTGAHGYIPRKTFLKFWQKSPEKFIRITFPSSVSKFIVNFDSYGPKDIHVKPFKFEAEVQIV